ncbi:MAG: hypothetical protein E5X74_17380 [Mesorhizobium sp.]|uniref:hypothetical protein n=1 Tax=Mesorhizobium sp. TaxID=1871066 RepID=UPI0011F62E1E|nr:hypothetical protein [Mesorhizobium sp.]TIO84048.1 MAG: hypothetical protein E5X74_17380 [Mesorhizobium sp.]
MTNTHHLPAEIELRERPHRHQLEKSQLYSEELGIDLSLRRDREYFRWFLASILFGGRISEAIARNTYRAFVRHGLTTPRKIFNAGWDFLVFPVLREGGYVRYDGKKSDQVLRDCGMLLDEYGGKLSRLEASARTNGEVEQRLLAFFGVGPVTANIFLRELRPHWPLADPEPLPVVAKMAHQLGIDLGRYDRKSLTFARLEAGLIRLRHTAVKSRHA